MNGKLDGEWVFSARTDLQSCLIQAILGFTEVPWMIAKGLVDNQSAGTNGIGNSEPSSPLHYRRKVLNDRFRLDDLERAFFFHDCFLTTLSASSSISSNV